MEIRQMRAFVCRSGGTPLPSRSGAPEYESNSAVDTEFRHLSARWGRSCSNERGETLS